jgi:protein SCO1/2
MAVQASSQPHSTKPLRFHWWWLAVALVAVVVVGILAFAILKPVKVLPRIRQAPGFILADQDGQRLTSEDLRGKVVVYNFLYTGCGEACDAMNATMQDVQHRLGEVDLDGLPVQFVTISFDPSNDTPEALKTYADSLGADPARWRFVTGDAARVKQVIGTGFEAFYKPADQGGFQFDPKFVLVDGLGIIRSEYKYQVETPDADRILRHLGVLAEEVRKATGVNKLVYEAAHLFLCYAN